MDSVFGFLKENFFVESVLRLLLATLIGGLIGSERGKHGRAAGLRTHILVCIGAALTSLTSVYLDTVLGNTGDIARLSAQVISGMGFLGAGTILIRNNSMITGLTTAAGMWATAAIGVAIGYGFYVGAAVATLVCIFTVTALGYTEKQRRNLHNFYFELAGTENLETLISILSNPENKLFSYDIIPAKSGISGNVGVVAVLNTALSVEEIKEQIKSVDNIVFAVSELNM